MTEEISKERIGPPLPTDGILRVSSLPGRALIRVLAIAHRRQFDAAPLVEHLAGEFPGDSGKRMKQLARVLATGVSAVEAVSMTPGLLDRSTVTALQLAQEDGRLAEMYQALLAENELDDPNADNHVNNAMAELMQIGFGLLVALFLLSFLMIYIVPTFEMMFNEFGLYLPTPTRLLISFANAFASVWPLVFLIVFLAFGIYFAFRGPAILASWRGGRLIPASINLRSLLAVAVQSGRPIASALPTLTSYCELPKPQRRLQKACDRVQRGEEPWRSLAAEKLISKREAEALSLAPSGPTQAWLLRWSAAARQSRRATGSRLFTQSISIVTTLAFGFLVAWTAISVFLVLSALISGLS